MQNQLYTNDNLYIMHGMNSASVDLIYLDPPFNTKRTYSAPIGSKAAGAAFKDMWSWSDVDEACLYGLVDYDGLTDYIQSVGNIHGRAMMAYLTYMAQRIIEMHRILKPTGGLYLHCDPTASHYLKGILDAVFGQSNFRNELIWGYNRFSRRGDSFPSMHDTILFYGSSKKITFNKLETAARDTTRYDKGYHVVSDRGETRLLVYDKKKAKTKIAEAKKMGRPIKYTKAKTPNIGSVWSDIPIINPQAKERTGYPTQKPLALLYRIIKASSNEGDVVFDPFCGCATALVAAQQLNRQWIGIDIEEQAANLLVERLSDDAGLFKDFIHLKEPPTRTDTDIIEPSPSVKDNLYAKQKGKCNGCENDYLIKDMEIDHIVPKSIGGGDHMENYQLLCGNCNRTKGNRPMEFLLMRIDKRKQHLRNYVTFEKESNGEKAK